MGSLGMLFYVVECFTVNLENLAADAVGSAQLGRVNQQIQCNCGFVAIALGETAYQINQIGALDAQRAKVRDDLAQLRTLILDGLLEAGEAADGLVGCGGDPAPPGGRPGFGAPGGLGKTAVQGGRGAAGPGVVGAGGGGGLKKQGFCGGAKW